MASRVVLYIALMCALAIASAFAQPRPPDLTLTFVEPGEGPVEIFRLEAPTPAALPYYDGCNWHYNNMMTLRSCPDEGLPAPLLPR